MSVEIDPELREQFKLKAMQERKTMKEKLKELIENYLKNK